ncbi:hypothetical protein QBC40DRAFT_236802 [Triangularia verruculosa]|uniref:Uncharacterized protein n=1 Tax=Triangularia verruculosa TaxID=2587418 RepID=A0AAN6X7J1_9PEZI|nr:hypothetical protein QBC40DRAFT_236802 [Triangularia verruculosa]
MAISLPQQRPVSPPTTKLHQALRTSLTPLTLTHTHLSLPQETTIHPILSTTLGYISKIYALRTTPSLQALLEAIFPSDTLPILLDQTGTLISGLDEQAKAILYIQAIAGLVLIFEHLSKHEDITAGIVERELGVFDQSEQKRTVLDKIEESGLLNECYTKDAVVEFLVEVIEGKQEEEEGVTLERTETTETVFINEKVDWDTGMGGRPYGNNGLPWGFTIMTLN